jgi:hypothetical protein
MNQDSVQFSRGTVSSFVVATLRALIILNPLSSARITRERTPRSVLLSTKTRNAHIPLVSHKRIPNHQSHRNIFSSLVSSSFSARDLFNHKSSCTATTPKIKTKIPLIKFIITAIVSGANQKPSPNGEKRPNQNAI